MIKYKKIKIICKNIKFLRKKNNMSVENLSVITGISLEILKQLDIGCMPNSFTIEHFFIICALFDKRPDELFYKLPKKP